MCVTFFTSVCASFLRERERHKKFVHLTINHFIIFSAIFQSMHEYDYRYKRYDFLAVRSPLQRLITIPLELLSLIAYKLFPANYLLSSNIALYLVLFAFEAHYLPIYDRRI